MYLNKDAIIKFCTVRNIFTAAYIVLVFTLLLIGSLGMKTRKQLFVDNRTASPFPEISVSNYRNIASEFERYFADRFGMRKHYVRVWNHLLLNVFGESPSDQIVLGRDGLFFFASHFAGKENRNSLFYLLLKYDSESIPRMASELFFYRDTFERPGIPILFVAVPTKHSLNFDKVPEDLRRSLTGNPRGIPSFTEVTRELRTMDAAFAEKYFLDLYPAAIEAERTMPMIPPKNFHWIPGPYTHLAAHLIAEKFGVIREPFVLSKENYSQEEVKSDLDALLDINPRSLAWKYSSEKCPFVRVNFCTVYPDILYQEVSRNEEFYAKNPSAPGGKILAVGDSFTPALCQDLARYFKEAAAMDLKALERYAGAEAVETHFADVVRCYKPDYVVFLSHGGYIFLSDLAVSLRREK